MHERDEKHARQLQLFADALVATVEQEGGHGPIPDYWREPMKHWFLGAILYDSNRPPLTLTTSIPSGLVPRRH